MGGGVACTHLTHVLYQISAFTTSTINAGDFYSGVYIYEEVYT